MSDLKFGVYYICKRFLFSSESNMDYQLRKAGNSPTAPKGSRFTVWQLLSPPGVHESISSSTGSTCGHL